MAIIIGKTKRQSIFRRPYHFESFDEKTIRAIISNEGSKKKPVTVELNLDQAINKIWLGLVNRSEMSTCNEYFKELPRARSLKKILLEDGDFSIYRLVPNQGKDSSVLAYACILGRDIGIDETLLFEEDPLMLLCTLIHEIAHTGGASVVKDAADPASLAAEKALPCCGCRKYYEEGKLGMINIQSTGKYASSFV